MTDDTIAKLKTGYIPGVKSKKITDEEVEIIGNILVTNYVQKGKKFTTSTVKDIITQKGWAERYALNGSGEKRDKDNFDHAVLNAGYNVLVRLGVIQKKAKSNDQPKS